MYSSDAISVFGWFKFLKLQYVFKVQEAVLSEMTMKNGIPHYMKPLNIVFLSIR